MKKNLYIKILVGYLLVASFAISLLWLIGIVGIRNGATERLQKEMRGYAEMLANTNASNEESIVAFSEAIACQITVIDSAGEVIAASEQKLPREDHFNLPEIIEARLKGTGEAIRRNPLTGEKKIYIAHSLRTKDGSISGYVRVARSFVEIEEAIGAFNRLILTVFILSLIPCLFLSLLVLRRIIEPMRRIEKHTAQIVKGEDPGTLIIPRQDEFSGLVRNINEMYAYQHEKLVQLREERRKLAATFANLEDGVMLLDNGLRIEEINPGMLKLLRKTRKEAIGRVPLEILRSGELHKALKANIATGLSQNIEVAIDEADQIFWNIGVACLASSVLGREKIVIVARDISRIKRLERSRSDFVANIAHELKTPLSAIIGFSQMLVRGEVEGAKEQEFLERINANAARLDHLTRDLLTLFELEFGYVSVEMVPVALAPLITEALSLVSNKEKGLAITNNSLDVSIMVDKEKALTALINILSNAIRYTEQGAIAIETQINDGFAVVSIADTGIGIDELFIARLGERFFRVDGARSRQLGGTGLGLSIVKHAMRLFGGRMEIRSRLGKGTTVKLFFPCASEGDH
ncbi:MAG: HAMP domain-containing protein [Deltaproteobacteria bacterium]|nr:HAMP domain-containing protein [Deltaproteobacteria bacterium]